MENPYDIEADWDRMYPIRKLPPEDIYQLLSPCFGPNHVVDSILPLNSQSLANFNYRIQLKDMSNPILLRIYTHQKGVVMEKHVFEQLKKDFKVPSTYFTGHYGATAYGILSWVNGVSLVQKLPFLSESELQIVGRELGNYAARLHQYHNDILEQGALALNPATPYQERMQYYLDREPAGANLSTILREKIRICLKRYSQQIEKIDTERCLIHGDFKISNILCQAEDSSQIAAIIDWEHMRLGSRYMDLGLLFRGPLPQAFQDSFLHQYQKDFEPLPPDWQISAKLCDIFNLMSYLNTDILLPNTFRKIRQLLVKIFSILLPNN